MDIKQRHMAYKNAITKLRHKDNPKGYFTGLCYCIGGLYNDCMLYSELTLFKPIHRTYRQYWFGPEDKTSQDERLTALMFMIEMTRE